jgi:fructan beta-fructosidase
MQYRQILVYRKTILSLARRANKTKAGQSLESSSFMIAYRNLLALLFCLVFMSPVSAQPASGRADILVADFEGKDFGSWKATGSAFGPGPAAGTLANQMAVTGYLGKGLVNSYHGGDDSTGTLTSPAFLLERRYLNFLIGGGKYPGETCINLIVDGKVARTATGPNDRPGGSEHLDWHTWDVAELAGKKAVLEAVDRRRGGWGHITFDHIVQSDRKRQAEPAQRELQVTSRFLHLPVKTGAPQRRVRLLINGRKEREFDIELADAKPDFWVFCDLAAFQGQKLRITVDALSPESNALTAIRLANEVPDVGSLYREAGRPQFHFTSRRGWLNDPNGLVYHQGEYHLFYQHNPYGWNWGNMHWGHAVSKDLVRWRELPIAIYPKRYGDWAFSGSAISSANTGLGQGKDPVMVAAFTSTGRGECVVYSQDGGKTFTEIDGNPIIRHQGRDPRLLWHTGARHWVIAVYDEFEGKQWIAFYSSPDLKAWKFESRVDGFYECPDLFELPVDGDRTHTRWVLYAADGRYMLGSFDGRRFTPDGGKQQLWHGNFYAAQTFSNTPDGRRIQIGWGNGITFPGTSFNQQMTIPCELTLRTTPEGVRMFADPVAELCKLHGRKHAWTNLTLNPGDNPLNKVHGDLFDISAEIKTTGANAVTFSLRGIPVRYDFAKQEITCDKLKAPLATKDGKLRLRLLLDRGSIEIFGNGGRVAISQHIRPDAKNHTLKLTSEGGAAVAEKLEVNEMRSGW